MDQDDKYIQNPIEFYEAQIQTETLHHSEVKNVMQ